MFDISPRHRALFERGPGASVTAMVYGRQAYRHEAQAIKPAPRPPVAPWSNAAVPTQREDQDARRALKVPRTRRQPSTGTLRVAALVAAFNATAA